MDYAKNCMEMMKYCEVNQNYSYVELRNYAMKNNPEWTETLRKKNPRMTIDEYLKSARREARKRGFEVPTLMESLDKNVSQSEL